jgi:hypothetical protein
MYKHDRSGGRKIGWPDRHPPKPKIIWIDQYNGVYLTPELKMAAERARHTPVIMPGMASVTQVLRPSETCSRAKRWSGRSVTLRDAAPQLAVYLDYLRALMPQTKPCQ